MNHWIAFIYMKKVSILYGVQEFLSILSSFLLLKNVNRMPALYWKVSLWHLNVGNFVNADCKMILSQVWGAIVFGDKLCEWKGETNCLSKQNNFVKDQDHHLLRFSFCRECTCIAKTNKCTVSPRKWRILGPGRTLPFAKSAICDTNKQY